MCSYLSFDFGGFGDPFIGLCFSCVAKFMIGFFLICLCEGVPIFCVGIDIGVSSDEGFLFMYAYDSNNFCPLIGDVSFIIFFDDCGLDMIVVVDPVGHF